MDLTKAERNVKTALEKAYCYYSLHHECDTGIHTPSHAECKACMVEPFERIVRSNEAGYTK